MHAGGITQEYACRRHCTGVCMQEAMDDSLVMQCSATSNAISAIATMYF